MTSIWVAAACMGLLAVLGLAESCRLARSPGHIPIRFHVNDTRGKSSVTRLIAASLREAGIRTVAKATGTLPRLILPDGTEQPIHRKARANVIEQRDGVLVAAAAGVEALVVECMALPPQLQSLCEAILVCATHGVITNCRADHLDVMGPREDDVARALANTTPVRGTVFTAERRHLEVLRCAADDQLSQAIAFAPDDIKEVSDREMAGFRYDERKENVALALQVFCRDLGVDRAAGDAKYTARSRRYNRTRH